LKTILLHSSYLHPPLSTTAAASIHQLHYDMDEAALSELGKPISPALSSVVFLAKGTGGPTCVFDQQPSGPLGKEAHVVHPTERAYLLFKGNRLHCVLPPAVGGGEEVGGDPSCSSTKADEDGKKPRRLTLMIGVY
jgi:hypothetical protein